MARLEVVPCVYLLDDRPRTDQIGGAEIGYVQLGGIVA